MDIQELHAFKLADAIKFHKELNPKLWHDEKLDPVVRRQLLKIAEDFVEDLGVALHVKDITVSGSNAAFTYTPHSDLDLHVVVDMSQLPESDVYRELFTAKKTLYNEANDIRVRGIPIELYVQDAEQPHVSLGEYSVLHDEWLRIPKRQRANFDQPATREKYRQLARLVNLAMKTQDLVRVKRAIEIIRRYRQAGLHDKGEFSPENLAYKAIRKQGGIDKLYQLRDRLHGASLSIEEAASREDAIIKINKLRNTSGRSNAEIETINSIIDKMMKQYNIKPKELKNTVDPLSDKIDKARSDKHQAASALKGEWEKFKRGFFAEDEGNPTPTDVENIAAKINKFARQLRVTAELRQLPEAHFPAIELTDLFADNPGTGSGSKVMAELVRLADEAGLNVYLRPSNQGNKIFYSRFGFEKDNDHFGMMVRYPESDSDEEELNEAYTSKQQVIDHFVKNRKYGVPSSTAARQGAVAWERGWRGPKPKPPAVSTPPAKPWLPYKDDLDEALDSEPYLYHKRTHKDQPNKVFSTEGEYWFRTDNDLLYLVSIPNVGNGVNLSFGLYDETEKEPVHSIQGTGDARRVFATVIAIVKEEVNRTKPRKIYFTAYEPSRIRLYDAFIKRLDRELPEYKISDIDPAVYPGVYQLERKDSKDEEEVYEAAGAKIDAHRVGDTIWIDYFEVHVKGKGLGKAEYEKFEKSLPKDIKKIRLVASDAGYGPTHDFWDRMGFDYAYPDDDNEMVKLLEASGYIPSKKEANDPRYSAALTVDVHPDTMKKGAKGFGWKISRAGIPPQARPDGKIDESVINEGMTFNPVVEKEFLSGDWKGEKYWSGSDWERKVTIDCRDCDGTGKDRDHVCPYCRGTGKEEETVSAAPELQVSNANGEEIQRMLGLDPDYSGIIHNKDLPDTMRRLIRLKNKGSQQHTQDASVDRGAMRQQSDDQGVTHIGRGATMYDAGRSQSQVDRYIDQLIKIIKFAQENNTSLGWG